MIIRPVETEADEALFIDFPHRLYAGTPNWVPPLKMAERGLFDANVNPALSFCDVCRWVALDDNGDCVGRIAAIVNHLWNKKTGKASGRISRFEVVDNINVSHALLSAAEQWLRQQGMKFAVGPLGFSNLDQQGFTVAGFEHMAAMGSSLTMPYYPELIEAAGYEPLQDWNEYRIDVPAHMPRKVRMVAAAARKHFGLEVITYANHEDLWAHSAVIMDIFDESFERLFGTYPFTHELKEYYARRYFSVIDPTLVIAVRDTRVNKGRLLGFLLTAPSITSFLKECDGEWHDGAEANLAHAMANAKEGEVLLAAVLPEARRRGAFAIMLEALLKKLNARGIAKMESTAILDDNDPASSIAKMFAHVRHKQKRCYYKVL